MVKQIALCWSLPDSMALNEEANRVQITPATKKMAHKP